VIAPYTFYLAIDRTNKMATAEYVLPEKYTEDLKDENGNPMSKRYIMCCNTWFRTKSSRYVRWQLLP
jgi:hypothetical protein